MAISTNTQALAGRIGLLLLVLVIAYVVAFKRAGQQVDAFCGRVSTATDVSALPGIARDLGVKLHGPAFLEGHDGPVSAVVANPFTMGDYTCVLRASSMTGKVEGKSLGYLPGS